jgi:glucose/arabinose dehydrogenase
MPRSYGVVDHRDARGEIWAYGLRNLCRMAFDSKTGDLRAADIGQERVEEVNLIERGGNDGREFTSGISTAMTRNRD